MRLPYSLSEDCVLLFSPWYVLGGGEGESDSLNNNRFLVNLLHTYNNKYMWLLDKYLIISYFKVRAT